MTKDYGDIHDEAAKSLTPDETHVWILREDDPPNMDCIVCGLPNYEFRGQTCQEEQDYLNRTEE